MAAAPAPHTAARLALRPRRPRRPAGRDRPARRDGTPYGGDTTWANLAAAYAGLSAPLRAFVDTLRAEHRLGVGYQPRPGDDAYVRHLLHHQTATVHPLVRVHPETGERVLFVNGYYVEQIAGLSRPESAAILELLVEQATRPEYTVRFRWEPGSVAFWDNRATIHLAPGDHAHLDHPRTMHRVMLTGDVPVGVDGTPRSRSSAARRAAGEAAAACGGPAGHPSGIVTSSSTGGSTSCARFPVAA